MRILFVTPILPAPTSGGRTRLFNLIKQLAVRHDISVISFIQPPEGELPPLLEPFCQHVELVPFEGFRPLGKWHNRLEGWRRLLLSRRPLYAYTFPVDDMRLPLRCLLQHRTFDVVVFEFLFLVELLDEVTGTPTVLVEHNVESKIAQQMYVQAAHPIHRLRDGVEWKKLQVFEQRWLRRFPTCVAVSERDAVALRGMSPKTHVMVVPNGVDSCYFAPTAARQNPDTVLFFGTLNYGPNVDGLDWFCRQIWPRIREAKPDTKLEVVGLDPLPSVESLGHLPGVQITGFVPDIRHKLWSVALSAVPLRMGGGTRLKILESLAAGCPVVSTSLGAEGLALIDGEHLLIADTPAAFSQKVVFLLESYEARRRLAEAGRQFVAGHYDWSQIAAQLEQACLQVATAR